MMTERLIDKPTVLTLDAGGTNFVFSAIRDSISVANPVTLPSNANSLDGCLGSMVKGFDAVIGQLDKSPDAISFAFPGPADYPNGIIGDLGNLPCFRGGVALGPMLQERYGVPVFINNDGDLFAYGEAIAGLLPQVNKMLDDAGSPKRYRNLLGVTLGTGFGAGIVVNNQLFIGDNSAGAEIWLMRNPIDTDCFVEEAVSIRAIQRIYRKNSRCQEAEELTPKDIFDIIEGKRDGDLVAAKLSFQIFGVALGDALANALTLTDSIVAIGGGLSNAYKYFAPAMMNQLNGKISSVKGEEVNRLEVGVFDLENEEQREQFCSSSLRKVQVPFSQIQVSYDPQKRVGIGLSQLGTSQAVSVGAYAYAVNKLKR